VPNWICCSSMVPLHMGAERGLLGVGDMENEFTNACRAGASRGRVSAPESRYVP
jgi:hypothetical protein